jgi:hypothetical protein
MSLNKEELARADLRSGERVIRRGRPPSVAPKQAVKLRLDPDVVEPFPRHRPWLADPHQCEALSHLASNGFAAALGSFTNPLTLLKPTPGSGKYWPAKTVDCDNAVKRNNP